MDRQTISTYGWIIVAIAIIIAVMMTATPVLNLFLNGISSLFGTVVSQSTCNHRDIVIANEQLKFSETEHRLANVKKCANCGKIIDQKVTEAYSPHEYDENFVCVLCGYKHNHTFGDSAIVVPPTCISTGVRERTCVVCEFVEQSTVEINKNAHSWEIVRVNEFRCKYCGKRRQF